MLRFVARRVLESIPLLMGIAVLSFIFMQLAPGGPDALFARNGRMSAEQLANIRRSMGLDRPPYEQLLAWIANLFRGNLGISYSQYRPVSQVIGEVFPNTVILMAAGLMISLVSALVFGILAARKPYGPLDNISLVLQLFRSGDAGLLVRSDASAPLCGAARLAALGWDVQRRRWWPLDLLRHLVLPALTIAIGSIAGWSRYVRSSTVEELSQDYVRSARSKGLSERRVLTGHVLRNSLIPLATVVGIDVPLYLTGAVLTETVYSWPGMGRLFFDALTVRDYPVLMGILVFGAVLPPSHEGRCSSRWGRRGRRASRRCDEVAVVPNALCRPGGIGTSRTGGKPSSAEAITARILDARSARRWAGSCRAPASARIRTGSMTGAGRCESRRRRGATTGSRSKSRPSVIPVT